MTTAKKLPVSEEDYLTGEEISPVKHEYVDGSVYAMAGARNAHNIIAGNAFGILWSQLRRGNCRPFNSDTKIRICNDDQIRFYYPDLSVVCNFNAQTDRFQDEPALVIEVLSKATRRLDEGEKKEAYRNIPSLRLYLLAEQEAPEVVVWRRTGTGKSRFVQEAYKGLDAVVPLDEIAATLSLAALYEGVQFVSESD